MAESVETRDSMYENLQTVGSIYIYKKLEADDEGDSERQSESASPLARPELSTTPTRSLPTRGGTAHQNLANVVVAIKSLNAAVHFAYGRTLFTVHMPAVEFALRKTLIKTMKYNVWKRLYETWDRVDECICDIRGIVESRRSMADLLVRRHHWRMNQALAMKTNPQASDMVFKIDSALEALLQTTAAVPLEVQELLALPACPRGDAGAQERWLEMKVKAAQSSVRELLQATKELREFLDRPLADKRLDKVKAMR